MEKGAADQGQFASNVTLAQSLLDASDTALSSISDQLQRAQELMIRAGSDTLNDDNRAAISAELKSILDDVFSLANTNDSRGNALFGGGFTGYRFAHPERVTMPVLVLAGAADYAIGLPAQRALGQALPRARVVEYPGAGHFLYLDTPERFTRDVTDFLATP